MDVSHGPRHGGLRRLAARTAAEHAIADRAELEEVLHPTGFFRAKT